MRKLLRVPVRVFEYLEFQRKLEGCLLGEGACLHPHCRIGNFQGKRSAINIGARSQLLGELVVFGHGGHIQIGQSCFIGESSRIWSSKSVKIGDRVLISHGVNIHDNNSHSLSAAKRHAHFNAIFSSGHPNTLDDVPSAPIEIEDDVWIGFGSTILKGVKIGRGSVIGAETVVTKDVPAYAVLVGNPPRVIGQAKP
jgi:maltose O-acetyltransferase